MSYHIHEKSYVFLLIFAYVTFCDGSFIPLFLEAVYVSLSPIPGELPRPTIMGAAIDTACIVWGYTCGLRGNCWVYDVVTYRYTLFGVVCSTRLVAVLLLGFMLFYLVKYGLAHEKEEKKDYIDNKDSPKTKLDARESVC